MAEGAMTCASCGKPVGQAVGGGAAAAPATATTGGLTDNVAGLLAYVTIIPAIVFLVVEPYKNNRYVRFHSFQSIFFGLACFALNIVLRIVGLGTIIGLFLWPLLALAEFAVWVVLVVKAYQGQRFKLPVIGDMAEKQANS